MPSLIGDATVYQIVCCAPEPQPGLGAAPPTIRAHESITAGHAVDTLCSDAPGVRRKNAVKPGVGAIKRVRRSADVAHQVASVAPADQAPCHVLTRLHQQLVTRSRARAPFGIVPPEDRIAVAIARATVVDAIAITRKGASRHRHPAPREHGQRPVAWPAVRSMRSLLRLPTNRQFSKMAWLPGVSRSTAAPDTAVRLSRKTQSLKSTASPKAPGFCWIETPPRDRARVPVHLHSLDRRKRPAKNQDSPSIGIEEKSLLEPVVRLDRRRHLGPVSARPLQIVADSHHQKVGRTSHESRRSRDLESAEIRRPADPVAEIHHVVDDRRISRRIAPGDPRVCRC